MGVSALSSPVTTVVLPVMRSSAPQTGQFIKASSFSFYTAGSDGAADAAAAGETTADQAAADQAAADQAAAQPAAEQTAAAPTTATTPVAGGTTVTMASDANIRADASQTSDVLGVVSVGEQVSVIGDADGWYQVDYNGVQGFVNKNLVG